MGLQRKLLLWTPLNYISSPGPIEIHMKYCQFSYSTVRVDSCMARQFRPFIERESDAKDLNENTLSERSAELAKETN